MGLDLWISWEEELTN